MSGEFDRRLVAVKCGAVNLVGLDFGADYRVLRGAAARAG